MKIKTKITNGCVGILTGLAWAVFLVLVIPAAVFLWAVYPGETPDEYPGDQL